ncbi:MAG: glycosyltransferase [Candidatus Micrarchaeia archaeon]|jgi:glycosyltransferase involved in cell wall biosynthesis
MDVSVVIPALNEEKYIARCLKAVRAQKFNGTFEIIVSDGMSSDKTPQIAKKYADKVVFEKTRTIAAGRQRGIAAARGKIIAFTDADAEPHPGWLAELCAPFSDPCVVCTYGMLLLYDGTDFENALCKYVFPPYFKVLQFLNLPAGAGSNIAIRASALERIGGFNRKLAAGEDIELEKRLTSLGRLVFVENAVAEVSSRRIRKWGFPRFMAYHTLNTLRVHFSGTSDPKYEPVR